jgi:hypothetical protein
MAIACWTARNAATFGSIVWRLLERFGILEVSHDRGRVAMPKMLVERAYQPISVDLVLDGTRLEIRIHGDKP